MKTGVHIFYKNQEYRRLEKEKNIFFSYFISEIPNFFLYLLFQKILNVSSKNAFKNAFIYKDGISEVYFGRL